MAEMAITFDIPTIAWLQPGVARRILQEDVAHGVHQIEERIAAAARRNAAVDRGRMRDGIEIRHVQKPAQGNVLVSSAVSTSPETPYARDIERGTKPHWIADGEDFEGLQGWAQRKLGDAQRAYAVRHSIAKKGTAAQPFMEPASREIEPQVDIVMHGWAAVAVRRMQQI